MLDALVAQISLQRSCIDAIVSKLEAASVPEHVGMSLDLQASSLRRHITLRPIKPWLLQPWQHMSPYSAAVAALIVKAKLAVDKAENKAYNVVYHIADHPLTQDEWEAKYCSPGENVSN